MNILEEANQTVKSRDKEYGNPVKSWSDIAKIVSILTHKDITPEDCLTVLEVMKQVRQSYTDNRDNQVDLVGYVNIKRMIIDGGT